MDKLRFPRRESRPSNPTEDQIREAGRNPAALITVWNLEQKVDENLSNMDTHFRGTYTSLVSLQTTIPTGNLGDYADIDPRDGTDAQRYIWDVDNGWVLSVIVPSTLGIATPQQVKEATSNIVAVSPSSLADGVLGRLTNLLTIDKSSIVNAINEILGKINNSWAAITGKPTINGVEANQDGNYVIPVGEDNEDIIYTNIVPYSYKGNQLTNGSLFTLDKGVHRTVNINGTPQNEGEDYIVDNSGDNTVITLVGGSLTASDTVYGHNYISALLAGDGGEVTPYDDTELIAAIESLKKDKENKILLMSTSERLAYLTNPNRYAGQQVLGTNNNISYYLSTSTNEWKPFNEFDGTLPKGILSSALDEVILKITNGTQNVFRAVRANSFTDNKDSIFFQMGGGTGVQDQASEVAWLTGLYGNSFARMGIGTKSLTISPIGYITSFLADYLLDVQGNARIQGNLRVDGDIIDENGVSLLSSDPFIPIEENEAGTIHPQFNSAREGIIWLLQNRGSNSTEPLPPAVVNAQATPQADGTILLTWNNYSASPSVINPTTEQTDTIITLNWTNPS